MMVQSSVLRALQWEAPKVIVGRMLARADGADVRILAIGWIAGVEKRTSLNWRIGRAVGGQDLADRDLARANRVVAEGKARRQRPVDDG